MFKIVNNPNHRLQIAGKYNIFWPFPLAKCLNSSSAIVFGRYVFSENNFILKFFHNIFRKISDVKYWFYYRFHPKHKYHIIKTNLKPGYYDTDHRLLHGCMSLLCEFVEVECGGVSDLERKIVNSLNLSYDSEEERDSMKSSIISDFKIIAIYNWWKKEKPNNEKRKDELTYLIYSNNGDNIKSIFTVFNNTDPYKKELRNELNQLRTKMEKDEQKYLHQLIDIRYSLWS